MKRLKSSCIATTAMFCELPSIFCTRPEDARDVYQEAFLKIYKNLPRFRFECSFYTWMYRVVTNVCLDHLRRRSSRPEDQAPEYASNRNGDALRRRFL